MTKKHFIALADAIRTKLTLSDYNGDDLYECGYHVGEKQAIRKTVEMLADFCKSQNAQFNRERWLAYIAGECRPNGGRK